MRARDLTDGAVNATFIPSDPPRFGGIGFWPIEALAGVDGTADLAVRPIDRYVRTDTTFALESTEMAVVVAPGLSTSGLDAWNVGPLTDTDRLQLTTIADATPPEAWAVRGTSTARQSILALANAIADAWIRTPAAPLAARAMSSPAMAPKAS